MSSALNFPNRRTARLVAVVNGQGEQITSFGGGGGGVGGGTEYTEGDIDTTFTGPVVLVEGPSNTATPLQVDASKRLQVAIAANTAGLATAAKQDDAANLLTSINSRLQVLEGTVAGNELQVDVLSSALPAGAATAAKQDHAKEVLDNILAEIRGLRRASNPFHTFNTEAAIAAGSFIDLTSDQITPGYRAHLRGITISATVPFKADLRVLSEGLPTGARLVWVASNRGWDYTPPADGFFSVDGTNTAGFDGFTVRITNLDTSEPADVYVTFLWNEEVI